MSERDWVDHAIWIGHIHPLAGHPWVHLSCFCGFNVIAYTEEEAKVLLRTHIRHNNGVEAHVIESKLCMQPPTQFVARSIFASAASTSSAAPSRLWRTP